MSKEELQSVLLIIQALSLLIGVTTNNDLFRGYGVLGCIPVLLAGAM